MATKTKQFLIENLFLVLIYYLTAHLTLFFFTADSSNAVAIWPPTGISLAAVLRRGYRILPAIFIADLIITIEIEGFNEFISIVFSIAVGIQAMMAAWIGTKLIHRFIGDNNPLIDNRSIFLFFFLGGPVSLLLPTVLIIDVEYWLGMVKGGEGVLLGFFTWWIRGIIGVIIFSPIILITWGGKAQRPRILSVVIPLSIIFILLAWSFDFTKNHEHQRVKSIFDWKSQTLHTRTTNEINKFKDKIQELNAFLKLADRVDQNKFTHFSEHILDTHPLITGLAWLPRVTDKINDTHFPVEFVASKNNFQALLGVDFSANKSWKEILNTAKTSNEIQLIMPLRIYQKGSIQDLTALVLAVFNTNVTNMAIIEKKNTLKGYVMLLLPLQKIIINATNRATSQQINLNITGLGNSTATAATATATATPILIIDILVFLY